MDFLQSLCLYWEQITFERCMLNNRFSVTTLNTVIFAILFSLQNRSLEYFSLYFHFQVKPADFSCTFSFQKSVPGNDLISPPNQKRLDYNYKALKTGNVVNSDTVLTMLVQMTLWNFLKRGQSPLVYTAFWPLTSKRVAWETASFNGEVMTRP